MNLFIVLLLASLLFSIVWMLLSPAFSCACAVLPAPSWPGAVLKENPSYRTPGNKEIPNAIVQLPKKNWKMKVFSSIQEAKDHWQAAAPANNIFLGDGYLSVLEKNPPKNMLFRYVVFYCNGMPSGVAYCQLTPFIAEKSLRTPPGQTSVLSSLYKPLNFLIRKFFTSKKHTLLVCGNLLLTGTHGFWFREKLEKKELHLLLDEALNLVKALLEKEGQSADVTLIKDLSGEQRMETAQANSLQYREFTFQPNMVLDVPETWRDIDDYLCTLSSKYRVRYKKARSLSAGLIRKELSLEDLRRQQKQVCSLLCEIADNQDFNMIELHPGYLIGLKEELPERFRVFAYYQEEKLVGFFTTLDNHEELEAHFLGFSAEFNRSTKLYLNFLYDVLEAGIQSGATRIVYARTALEIKSTIGAKPELIYSYIHVNDCLLNKLLPSLIRYLQPSEEWIPRNPFK
jgi:hypothetical protein